MSTQKPTRTSTNDKLHHRISFPQIAAGALAAATAAILGSQLGVAGTVLGAAIASIATAIASTLYQAGLEKTHHQLRKLAKTGASHLGEHGPSDAARADTVPLGGGEILSSVDTATTMVDAPRLTSPATPDDDGPLPDAADSARPDPSGGQSPKRRWPVIVGASVASGVAAFVLALAGITGFEAVTGHQLSGGQGTTVGQAVRQAGSDTSQVSDAPDGPERSAAPTPIATPTTQPSASASETSTTTAPASTQATPSAASTQTSDTPTVTPSSPSRTTATSSTPVASSPTVG